MAIKNLGIFVTASGRILSYELPAFSTNLIRATNIGIHINKSQVLHNTQVVNKEQGMAVVE